MRGRDVFGMVAFVFRVKSEKRGGGGWSWVELWQESAEI